MGSLASQPHLTLSPPKGQPPNTVTPGTGFPTRIGVGAANTQATAVVNGGDAGAGRGSPVSRSWGQQGQAASPRCLAATEQSCAGRTFDGEALWAEQ